MVGWFNIALEHKLGYITAVNPQSSFPWLTNLLHVNGQATDCFLTWTSCEGHMNHIYLRFLVLIITKKVCRSWWGLNPYFRITSPVLVPLSLPCAEIILCRTYQKAWKLNNINNQLHEANQECSCQTNEADLLPTFYHYVVAVHKGSR